MKSKKYDLTDGTTYLTRTYETDRKIRYLEGRLYKNSCGRFEIDEKHGLYDGSEVELNLCGTWVKTHIELGTGEKYSAVGLKGLSLVGVTARVRV